MGNRSYTLDVEILRKLEHAFQATLPRDALKMFPLVALHFGFEQEMNTAEQ